MDEHSLRAKIEECGYWHHNIELAPGVWTNLQMGDSQERLWERMEPHVPKDLTGKSVLDLGCNAGYYSVQMKRRGAARVLGVESGTVQIRQAELVRSVLDLDIELVHDDVHRFMLRNEEEFDYVLFLGLFYHLRAPLLVLDRAALIVRERVYFQTVVVLGEPAVPAPDISSATDRETFRTPGFPKAFFIEKHVGGDHTNWWFLNQSCVEGVLRSSGFDRFTLTDWGIYVCEAPSDRSRVPSYNTAWSLGPEADAPPSAR